MNNRWLIPASIYRYAIWLLVVTGLGYACGDGNLRKEEVLTQYIEFVYQNDFAAAKALCTPAGQAHLDALESIMAAADGSTESSPPTIRAITCYPVNKTGSHACSAIVNDGVEETSKVYHLQETAAGWRVDQPPPDVESTVTQETIEKQ
ncbi:MAG: hypothetical protein AAGJ82_00920 [Bacteroidota bacterium]